MYKSEVVDLNLFAKGFFFCKKLKFWDEEEC